MFQVDRTTCCLQELDEQVKRAMEIVVWVDPGEIGMGQRDDIDPRWRIGNDEKHKRGG